MREGVVEIARDRASARARWPRSATHPRAARLHWFGPQRVARVHCARGRVPPEERQMPDPDRHLIGSFWHLDADGGILAHLLDGGGQASQPLSQLVGTEHAEPGRQDAQTQGHPKNAQCQRVSALKNPFVRFTEPYTPSKSPDLIRCRQRGTRHENAAAIRQQLKLRRVSNLAASAPAKCPSRTAVPGQRWPTIFAGPTRTIPDPVDHPGFRARARVRFIGQAIRMMSGATPANRCHDQPD